VACHEVSASSGAWMISWRQIKPKQRAKIDNGRYLSVPLCVNARPAQQNVPVYLPYLINSGSFSQPVPCRPAFHIGGLLITDKTSFADNGVPCCRLVAMWL